MLQQPIYLNQSIVLATCHGKERALRLPFRVGLGASIDVCACDTDQLGTFSGEIARVGDALATAQAKARLGLEVSGHSIALASEGSFGPHPSLPLLAVGMELLLLVDQRHGFTVVEQRLEWRTNYSHTVVDRLVDLDRWLRQIAFPSHAVIVRPLNGSSELLFKGVRSNHELSQAFACCRVADPEGQVWLETDMRAHCNPTRMRSIRRLGIALVRRLRAPCPECGLPGWGLVDTQPGLPCRDCGTATNLTLSESWGCQHCGAQRPRLRRDGLSHAEPGQCPCCNP